MARPLQITDDTIVKALAAGGEVTAGNLADRLGMGQSTAAKRLAALEAAGGVRRAPGGRVNGVRAADRLVERRRGGRQRRACRTRYRRLGHQRASARGGGAGGARRVGSAGPGGARDLGTRLPGCPAGRGVRAECGG